MSQYPFVCQILLHHSLLSEIMADINELCAHDAMPVVALIWSLVMEPEMDTMSSFRAEWTYRQLSTMMARGRGDHSECLLTIILIIQRISDQPPTVSAPLQIPAVSFCPTWPQSVIYRGGSTVSILVAVNGRKRSAFPGSLGLLRSCQP